MRLLFFGDLVGAPGCAMFQKYARKCKQMYSADAIIVNGENSATNGRGMTQKSYDVMKHNGADLISGGNHSFQKRAAYNLLDEKQDVVRPYNFPKECPGRGVATTCVGNTSIGLINIQGNIFLRENLACPLKAFDTAYAYLKDHVDIIIVDMHAEATSEKLAMGYYCDGKAHAVVGTHTHVQTADNRILPHGTAYITDLGMSGALHSMIGMEKEPIISGMQTQLPVKFNVAAEPPYVTSGVMIDVDARAGTAKDIQRIYITEEEQLL